MAKKSMNSRNARASTNKLVGNKTQQILRMLQRPNGASISELAKATDWQTHSVRGFIAGTLKKKRGLEVASSREGGQDRRYRIEQAS